MLELIEKAGRAMSLEAELWQLITMYPKQAVAVACVVAVATWGALFSSGDSDGGWLDSDGDGGD